MMYEFKIEGLKLVSPRVFEDDRGWFFESWNEERYGELGIDCHFAQDNHSRSAKNTLRGLHFQSEPGQAKLVRVSFGKIWDVAVDLRSDSPTFGKWEAVELDAERGKQFFIPVGFAHGFCVLSDFAEVQYKCSSVYNGKTECSLAWNDPDIAVKWPIENPLLSERDQTGPSFADYLKSQSVL